MKTCGLRIIQKLYRQSGFARGCWPGDKSPSKPLPNFGRDASSEKAAEKFLIGRTFQEVILLKFRYETVRVLYGCTQLPTFRAWIVQHQPVFWCWIWESAC
jgi:hypothetical protein